MKTLRKGSMYNICKFSKVDNSEDETCTSQDVLPLPALKGNKLQSFSEILFRCQILWCVLTQAETQQGTADVD